MEEISNWILSNLSLEISKEKTKLTNLNKQPAKFLGFTITHKKPKIRYIRKKKTFLSKTGTAKLYIGVDDERLTERLIMKGYCNEKLMPTHKSAIATFDAHVIIEAFNSVIRGLISYYAPVIDNRWYMNKYSYILAYSCMKTLATKYHSTIFKLTTENKFGYPPSVIIKGKHDESKTVSLLYLKSFKAFYDRILLSSEQRFSRQNTLFDNRLILETPVEDNPFNLRILNYRSGTLLFLGECAICGSSNKVELHHVNHIRKMGEKNKGFKRILSSINRKKIMVCRECHLRIHKGTYYSLDLSDFIIPVNAVF